MTVENTTDAFVALGSFLRDFLESDKAKIKNGTNVNSLLDNFENQLVLAQQHNAWFTKSNLISAIESWADNLTRENLNRWVSNEDIKNKTHRKVAIVAAGNIPLVSFHDFLSVLISGHSVLVKLSSKDKILLPFIANYLISVQPELKDRIEFTEKKLTNFDAVIATGSDNSARYFDYYFRDKPNIIRKNRNSVAVLTADQTEDELTLLGDDIFSYFGLGCRNVSKLFVPRGYCFDNFFKSIYKQNPIIDNKKYANNYDYNKAIYLMSEFSILENGFLMLKEDNRHSSPIATLFYQYYDDLSDVKSALKQNQDRLQCVVSKGVLETEVPFGQTQKPKLWDYADRVNTLNFLSKI